MNNIKLDKESIISDMKYVAGMMKHSYQTIGEICNCSWRTIYRLFKNTERNTNITAEMYIYAQQAEVINMLDSIGELDTDINTLQYEYRVINEPFPVNPLFKEDK